MLIVWWKNTESTTVNCYLFEQDTKLIILDDIYTMRA